MLPAPHRLRSPADFRATVRAGGSRRSGRLLVVHLNRPADGSQAPARVGFIVSKAVGGAVVRNRTKRRLRALVADRLSALPGGTDLVVRANPQAGAATSAQLGAELTRLLSHAMAGTAR